MLAEILAAKVGNEPWFGCCMMVLLAVAVIVGLLVKKGQKALKAQAEARSRTPVRRPAAGQVVDRGQERRQAANQTANSLGEGLEFHASDPWDLPEKYNDFDLFEAGHARQATNVMAGDFDGRPVILCDYEYKTGQGLAEAVHRCQVAVMELPIVAPRLEMRNQDDFAKIPSWAGHTNLLVANAEFNRRFHVRCEEPTFAFEIIHAGFIRYLLGCVRVPNMVMKGSVLLLTFDGRGDVDLVRQLLAFGQNVIGSLQESVLMTRGSGAPPENSGGAGDG
jgi:hypothetical protein